MQVGWTPFLQRAFAGPGKHVCPVLREALVGTSKGQARGSPPLPICPAPPLTPIPVGCVHAKPALRVGQGPDLDCMVSAKQ